MLTLQEISDRLELQQLAVDYAHAIDSRCFDLLDHVFTPDAHIDYRVFGGIDGRYPAVKQWLKEVLTPAPAYQHLVSNFDLKIDGDRNAAIPAGNELIVGSIIFIDVAGRERHLCS